MRRPGDRSIRTCLKEAKLPWLRFHAFRRGVVTNLHDAGVNDLTIQRVLRHSRCECDAEKLHQTSTCTGGGGDEQTPGERGKGTERSGAVCSLAPILQRSIFTN